MKKKVIAVIMVVTILVAFLFPFAKTFTKPTKADVCYTCRLDCILPTGARGAREWLGTEIDGSCIPTMVVSACQNFC